jgi:hypothetical protein
MGTRVVFSPDSDEKKGAFEDDTRRPGTRDKGNASMAGQLGHRNKPVDYEDADTDYPDPTSSGEHSGQK